MAANPSVRLAYFEQQLQHHPYTIASLVYPSTTYWSHVGLLAYISHERQRFLGALIRSAGVVTGTDTDTDTESSSQTVILWRALSTCVERERS
jgi:hypothetical protein